MFVRGPNPIWFFDNLFGMPFDDTYYAFFLTNTLPYLPQSVFEDPNGNTPWENPIEFQPSSGLPNNLYFDPTLVYRIEMRQGPDQTSPLIWLIQNYIAGSGGSSVVISDPLVTATNMITNPQFSDIDFVSPLEITTAGTYDLGPGWSLVLTGVGGSTTVTQIADPGINQIQGNPPYYLTFNNSGWATAQLIQTFNNNGAIFGGGAIAVAFSAFATGADQTITVSYQPSSPTGPGQTILEQLVSTGDFQSFENAIDLPASTNTNTGQAAFVNIVFTLPVTGIISLTNIQITGQSTHLSMGFIDDPIPPTFEEQTYERTVDQEFHVYKNSLLTQPKENLLVGWTFALNPYQFWPFSPATVGVNQYTLDQTIFIQQNYVATGTGSNVGSGQGTAAQNFGMVGYAVSATNQFAILQYIDASTIAPYFNQTLSCMVNASSSNTNSIPLRFKMRLIVNSAIPSATSRVYPISSWAAGSDPLFDSGFTVITPLNDPVYTLTTTNNNFSFDQFILPPATSDTMTLGVLIYTISNMDFPPSANAILFNRVSLVPNDFAIDASPETWDETFRKCQFYYEQSYPTSGLIGSNTLQGIRYSNCPLLLGGTSSLPSSLSPCGIQLIYNTVKRAAAPASVPSNINFFGINTIMGSGPGGVVQAAIANGNGYPTPSMGSNPVNLPINGIFFIISSTNTGIFIKPGATVIPTVVTPTVATYQGEILYHYVMDVRIG